MTDDQFLDQVTIITGAAGGIGSALARRLARSGMLLVLADRPGTALDGLARALDQTGSQVAVVAYDASDPTAGAGVVTEAVRRHGHIDHLVPAAGIYEEILLADLTAEQWRRTMAINLDAVFQICQAAVPHIRVGGTIVTIASGAAHQGCSPGAHYAASKGAILAFTRSLAKELSPRIRANVVSPGVISTPMTAELMRGQSEKYLSLTPARRFGQAEEVADVIAFLCSKAAGYINGEAIHINGGYYMGG